MGCLIVVTWLSAKTLTEWNPIAQRNARQPSIIGGLAYCVGEDGRMAQRLAAATMHNGRKHYNTTHSGVYPWLCKSPDYNSDANDLPDGRYVIKVITAMNLWISM